MNRKENNNQEGEVDDEKESSNTGSYYPQNTNTDNSPEKH
jgi:hypothetical protein